jgi:hypothetical protein
MPLHPIQFPDLRRTGASLSWRPCGSGGRSGRPARRSCPAGPDQFALGRGRREPSATGLRPERPNRGPASNSQETDLNVAVLEDTFLYQAQTHQLSLLQDTSKPCLAATGPARRRCTSSVWWISRASGRAQASPIRTSAIPRCRGGTTVLTQASLLRTPPCSRPRKGWRPSLTTATERPQAMPSGQSQTSVICLHNPSGGRGAPREYMLLLPVFSGAEVRPATGTADDPDGTAVARRRVSSGFWTLICLARYRSLSAR